jgi:hypothetical protein
MSRVRTPSPAPAPPSRPAAECRCERDFPWSRVLTRALARPQSPVHTGQRHSAEPSSEHGATFCLDRIGVRTDRARAARHQPGDPLARDPAGERGRRFVRTTIPDRHAAPFPDPSHATSRPPGPTESGSPTSPSCRRGATRATSPGSPTSSPAGSSAGAWPPTGLQPKCTRSGAQRARAING